MKYYLNPYMLIVKHGNCCYYYNNDNVYYLTLREYETLKNSINSIGNLPKERINFFVETKLLIGVNYEEYYNETDFLSRGWFEMSHFEPNSFLKLSKSTILILGCGGTGTHVAWNLAALGIKSFILIDDDIVEKNNLNRQILYDLNDIGRYKVDALEKKLKDRFSNIEILTFKRKVNDGVELSNIVDINNVSVVVKGIDTPLDNMYEFGEYFRKNNIKYVSGGTVGNKVFIGPTFSPTLKNLFRETNEYLSNADMKLAKRISGKAVSIAPIFSYIGSELTKEIIFLLTDNENKVLYNDKIMIKDIFDYEKEKSYSLDKLIKVFISIMVMVSSFRASIIYLILSLVLLLLFQIHLKESDKSSFIDYILLSAATGINSLIREGLLLSLSLRAVTSSIFLLLSYICYYTIMLMLVKFIAIVILKRLKKGVLKYDQNRFNVYRTE